MADPTHARPRRQLVIGLLWHSVNSDNLGVGALTQSNITIFEKVARDLDLSLQFRILGWYDRRKPYVTGSNVRALPLNTRRFLSLFDGFHAAVRNCDLVCDIGAGDSFTDLYGLKRFAYLAFSKAVVLATPRPLLLGPQTIGPFRRSWTARLARNLIQRCGVIAVRDHQSLAMLDELKVRQPAVLSADVAFRLPYVPSIRDDTHVHVGVNVSGLLFHGGYDRRNMFGLSSDYPTVMRSLLRHFTNLPNCQVHLISHVISDGHDVEDDYRVAVMLSKAFPKAVAAPRFGTPSEAKSYIARMDFFCGSRMHACIAALSTGVPVIPLAYSSKFEGLFGSLGYPYIIDCRVDQSDEVVAKVVDAFERRDQLNLAARPASRKALARLLDYEDALRGCLARAATGPA